MPWQLSGDRVFTSCHDELSDFKVIDVSGPEVFFRFDAQTVPSLAVGSLWLGFPPLTLRSPSGEPRFPGSTRCSRTQMSPAVGVLVQLRAE